MVCPNCGSENVTVQVVQENSGSITTTKTKSKYKEAGHGCLWWLLIGWWWWIVDLFLWIFAFFPRFLVQLFKKKKYKGTSTSTAVTTNSVSYKTICLCQDCGNRWEVQPQSTNQKR